jgi:hypothetical protein
MRQAAAGDADHFEEPAEKFPFRLTEVSSSISFSFDTARRCGDPSRVYIVFLTELVDQVFPAVWKNLRRPLCARATVTSMPLGVQSVSPTT